MTTPLITLLAIAAVAVLYVLLPIGMDAYFRLRGPRVVTCPDTQAPVEVHLDAGFGALKVLSGRPALRVEQCARWQEGEVRDCAQGCLHGIDALVAGGHGLLTRPLQATSPTARHT